MIKAQSLKKSGLISIVLAITGKVLSFSAIVLVAHFFGASKDTDMIFFLYAQIILLSGFWTHFNSNILLPNIVHDFSEQPQIAWQKCCNLGTRFLISILIIVPVIYFFHAPFLKLSRAGMSALFLNLKII